MTHLHLITRPPAPAQEGNVTPLESIIIALVSVIFQDWDNFQGVLQNLRKFYSKTP